MRVIIRCAGDGTRWGNFRGVPKHLVKICGEPVLERAVRLIKEIAPDADIKIVVTDLSDKRYLIPGSSRTKDKPNPANGDIDKIASSRRLWGKGRTVLIWGDIWWGRETLVDVLTAPVDGWHAWARTWGNEPAGELFAFAFDDHKTVGAALDAALVAQSEARATGGKVARGGWSLLRTLCGLPLGQPGPYVNTTQVTDWTDDMDGPKDWREWCYRYGKAPESTREEMTK